MGFRVFYRDTRTNDPDKTNGYVHSSRTDAQAAVEDIYNGSRYLVAWVVPTDEIAPLGQYRYNLALGGT